MLYLDFILQDEICTVGTVVTERHIYEKKTKNNNLQFKGEKMTSAPTPSLVFPW